MPELVDLALPWLVGLFAAMGAALVGHSVSRGWVGWLAEVFVNIPLVGPLSASAAVRLNEWLSNQLAPSYGALEGRVTKWFNGMGQTFKWQQDNQYRHALAFSNFVHWYYTKGSKEILAKANAEARTAAQKNALTKAPPIPQRRITQKDADIEFQKIIEREFVQYLKEDFPQFDWEPKRWRKWLGVLPALGGAVVTGPKPPLTKPTPVKVKVVKPTVPIAPPQPTTLPRTDDKPTPEPGTQVVPGVLSAKDKWARGQIVRLKDFEESTRKHLGPLAFLALPAIGITTLIGLLDCKNVQRGLKSFCSMPSNLLSDLLALITDFLVLTNICTVLPWIEDAANEVLPFITDFTTGAAALACSNSNNHQVTLSIPTLQLPSSTATLPALQLP